MMHLSISLGTLVYLGTLVKKMLRYTTNESYLDMSEMSKKHLLMQPKSNVTVGDSFHTLKNDQH